MRERLLKTATVVLRTLLSAWNVARLSARTARIHVPSSVLLMGTVLVGLLIILQGLAATQLSTKALQTTESTVYRHVAKHLAEKFRVYSEQFSQPELQMRLNEVAAINPHVRLYIIDEHGIVKYVPHRYGRTELPFVDFKPVKMASVTSADSQRVFLGDDPHDYEAKVPFSVAPIRLGGGQYFLYVVTSSGTMQSYFERAAGLKLGLSTFGLALISTGIIVSMVFLLMYRKLKAVSTALAVLSHDLRGPLTSIQGALESMEEKGSLSTHDLKIALRSTKSATAMLNDLHHISRIQATDHEVSMEPLSIADLLMDCVMAVKPICEEKGLEITVGIPKGIPLVNGNVELLERMVRNLVDNAIRYTPSRGRIDVSVAQLDKKIRVTVHDTGVGIPQEQLERVSERFVRGANVSGRVQGSGIGLSVASEVARLHGGQLKILSREGEGTAIIFDLSVWQPTAARRVKAAQ
jgi:signal transduction histidine kinase